LPKCVENHENGYWSGQQAGAKSTMQMNMHTGKNIQAKQIFILNYFKKYLFKVDFFEMFKI